MYALYRFLTTAFFLPFSLAGQSWCDEKMRQRLGNYPESLIRGISGNPRIWIHAVSVGEVGVAIPIIRALKTLMPGCAVILSTTTTTGQNIAFRKLGNEAVCIYAPLDFPSVIRKALSAIRPDIMVFLETEIWPNWLTQCHEQGVKIALINGRISVRSVKKYLKIRPLMAEVLSKINTFGMISHEDAERIRQMGAPAERIRICGNAKYELTIPLEDSDIPEKKKHLYNAETIPVFVAGSTRKSEEEIILGAYREILRVFPETLLIIAPRHIERSHKIRKLAIRQGFSCQFGTELRNTSRFAQVVILDTIGELRTIYSIASVVFCGGSLVPKGGQNIIEPAIWAKPVFYGPSTEDFQDARVLLEKYGGGMMVRDGRELAEKAIYYLSHPRGAATMGERAKLAIMENKGAAARHAQVVFDLLGKSFS